MLFLSGVDRLHASPLPLLALVENTAAEHVSKTGEREDVRISKTVWGHLTRGVHVVEDAGAEGRIYLQSEGMPGEMRHI